MRKRTDANHTEIVEALRACGASVQSLADVGGGCPDVLCGYRGENYLFEIKQPGEDLRDNQLIWHSTWQGHVATIKTVDEALKAIGVL